MRSTLLKALVLSTLLFGVFSHAQAAATITQTSPSHFTLAGYPYFCLQVGTTLSSPCVRGDIPPGTITTSTNQDIAFGFCNIDSGGYCNIWVETFYIHVDSSGNMSGPYPLSIPDVSTHFISPYTPSNGSIATSTSVSFSVNYYFNDSTSYGLLNTVAFDLVDVTTGSSAIRFGTASISASGQNSVSAVQALTAGHLYLWHPVMYSSTGSSTPISGDFYSLEVVYASASSTPFTGATVGTSTLPTTTNLLSFLNIPQLLATKVPFGYFFQSKNAIELALHGSTTTAIPSGTFSYKIPGHATSSMDLFSTSTIAYFVSNDSRLLLRGLMVAVLYFELVYLLYHRAKSQKLV